ncbi:MAG: YidC/Oxa1 family rane protein insertase [Candidatus Sumerlaeota bacterium]|nr:YidC/Oxa1 family rane protein insertase [Candidatus Sumerlaeota bacterium]
MDKRWITFFLVFTVAYFFLIAPILNRRAMEKREAAGDQTVEVAAAETPAATPSPTPREADSPEAPPTDAAPETSERPAVSMDEVPAELVETGVATIVVSRLGAVPISWKLQPTDHLAPVVDFDSGTTYVVNLVPQVPHTPEREYPLQFTGRTVDKFNREVFDLERTDHDDGTVELKFTSPTIDDIRVVKTYRFQKNSYVTDLTVEVTNGQYRTRIGDAEEGWGIGWQGGFMQPRPGTRQFFDEMLGTASVGGELRHKSLDADDDPVSYPNDIGWAAIEKKYFTSILVPAPENPASMVLYAVRRRNMTPEYDVKGVDPPLSMTLHHPQAMLEPGESTALSYKIIATPKNFNDLKSLSGTVPMADHALPLSDIVFGKMIWGQNWLRPIALLLLWALHLFERLVGNWGMAIIVLVLVVKILLYPLSHWAIKAQAKTMAEQQRIKPLLDKLNEKYKDDPSKKSQEMMKLYREHGINPLGAMRGCLPMVLQMPIFFALYALLAQAVEIRGQSFLWIHDLAQPDRLIPFGGFVLPIVGWTALNILPILMAVTQYFTSKLMTSNVSDPTQRQIMALMPIFFVFILYNMPAGLMLYWTVQNIWQIGHTVLTKRYVAMHDTSSAGGPAADATA